MQKVDFNQALGVLRSGEILIYPTETFYGLGVDVFQASALEKLFALKGRPATQAVSVLVASLEQAANYGDFQDPPARRLAECYWPGPLTLVVPASSRLPEQILAADRSIGIRVSSHPMAARLAEAFGSPISTTSANPSGQASAVTERQIEEYFQDASVYFLSGGDLPQSLGSTIVKVENGKLKLLRDGEIPFREIS